MDHRAHQDKSNSHSIVQRAKQLPQACSKITHEEESPNKVDFKAGYEKIPFSYRIIELVVDLCRLSTVKV